MTGSTHCQTSETDHFKVIQRLVVSSHLRHTADDDVHNGLALCHLCHWTFDEGLMAVNKHYQLQTSPHLRQQFNLPFGALRTSPATFPPSISAPSSPPPSAIYGPI
ncbi:MAG: HNH endonuclease [Ardenticatenaceae bacterium]|nr:HNH endonuclease [Ardenticatenaceae bacterium]